MSEPAALPRRPLGVFEARPSRTTGTVETAIVASGSRSSWISAEERCGFASRASFEEPDLRSRRSASRTYDIPSLRVAGRTRSPSSDWVCAARGA